MIAVPPDAAAHVQENLRQEHQDRAQLVGDGLGRMVVAGVERQQLPPRERVRMIELVRADRVALTPDAKQLSFDGVAVERWVNRLSEDRIERFDEPFPGLHPVDRGVFHPVGDPEVRHARVAQGASDGGADTAAGDTVRDPELADGRVPMREREVVGGVRVRKERGVEVEPDTQRARPVDPAGEVFRPDPIAVHGRAAELAVECMQVEPVPAGDQRERPLGVCPQLIGSSGLAWIAPRRCQASSERRAEPLEPPHIVSLPAME